MFGGDGEANAVSYAPGDRLGAGSASVGHGGMEVEVGFVVYGIDREGENVAHGMDGEWIAVRRPDKRIISVTLEMSSVFSKYEISSQNDFPFFFSSKGIYSF
ncbi:MAG: hypothetical protein WA194_00535 [Patescibacteria group bacterium]